MHVRNEHEIVLVHDGARPFVTGALIERTVAGAKEFGAVAPGIPVRDTVRRRIRRERWWRRHSGGKVSGLCRRRRPSGGR